MPDNHTSVTMQKKAESQPNQLALGFFKSPIQFCSLKRHFWAGGKPEISGMKLFSCGRRRSISLILKPGQFSVPCWPFPTWHPHADWSPTAVGSKAVELILTKYCACLQGQGCQYFCVESNKTASWHFASLTNLCTYSTAGHWWHAKHWPLQRRKYSEIKSVMHKKQYCSNSASTAL